MKPIYENTRFKRLNWTQKNKKKALSLMTKYENMYRKELIRLEKRILKNKIKEVEKTFSIRPNSRREKFTTTKIIIYIILCNCIMVEIYSMWAMYVLKDLTPLYSLIGSVISQSLSFGIYCLKSFKDTKEEVKSKLERDKFEAGLISDDEELLGEDFTKLIKAKKNKKKG